MPSLVFARQGSDLLLVILAAPARVVALAASPRTAVAAGCRTGDIDRHVPSGLTDLGGGVCTLASTGFCSSRGEARHVQDGRPEWATEAELIDRALADRYLICRARGTLCAFAVERVVETMRPQPLERLANAPPFVLGLSVIRGAPLPVIDLSALLGTSEERPRRFVTVRVGARRVAVAVSEVIGIRTIPRERLETLPSLLGDAADVARSLGVLDSELLLVLHDARLVPEWVWASLETGGPRS